MTGNQKWMVFNALGAVCFNAMLMIILVPRYGIIGAAWSMGITLALANIIALAEVYFLLGVHPYDVRYFKLMLLALMTAGFTWAMKFYFNGPASVVLILVQITFIYICYLILLLLFGLTKKERITLRKVRNSSLPALVKNILEGKNSA